MNSRISNVALILITFTLLVSCGKKPAPTAKATVIRNVRVFDGSQSLPTPVDVTITNGKIQSVSEHSESDEGTEIIDGGGQFLIPGLIDSHMHAGDGLHALERELVFGVTTSFGMFDDPAVARQMRVETYGRASFRSAGIGATAPNGHGTEYGEVIPTVSSPAEADRFVADRVAEGSDYLKIIAGPARMPMLDEATIHALVVAAHRRHLMAVAHVDRLRDARMVVRAGVDALVHIFCDEVADDDFVNSVISRHVFIVPTLTIRQRAVVGSEWQGNGEPLLHDSTIDSFLIKEEREQLSHEYSGDDQWRIRSTKNVEKLFRAGATILAGSDAPNPGTTWGVSLHQELRLLVDAGLPAEAVLSSATFHAAEAFGLRNRGRIAPGFRADLVMLACDPAKHIECTSHIDFIWKEGRLVRRGPRSGS
jgi:imidazolonepropionase-like amidohydrolase